MEPQNNTAKKSRLTIILVILIIMALVFSGVYFNKYRKLTQDPNKENAAKISELIQKVGKIIDLPTGENPVMATITDTAPLANNPFFAHAKIGDQVLLYAASKKAYLYDPKANLLIEVASLNIGNK